MNKVYHHYQTDHHSCHWMLQGRFICEFLRDVANTPGDPMRVLGQKGCRTVAQCDCEEAKGKTSGHVFWPQISMVEQLMEQLPNARFIMMTRNTTAWISSLKKWHEWIRSSTNARGGTQGASMYDRLKQFSLPGLLPGSPATEEAMGQWQQDMYQRARDLAAQKGAHFLEYSLEHGSPCQITEFLGLPDHNVRFWGVANHNKWHASNVQGSQRHSVDCNDFRAQRVGSRARRAESPADSRNTHAPATAAQRHPLPNP